MLQRLFLVSPIKKFVKQQIFFVALSIVKKVKDESALETQNVSDLYKNLSFLFSIIYRPFTAMKEAC